MGERNPTPTRSDRGVSLVSPLFISDRLLCCGTTNVRDLRTWLKGLIRKLDSTRGTHDTVSANLCHGPACTSCPNVVHRPKSFESVRV